MDKAMAAERFPLWKRACDTIDDINLLAMDCFAASVPSIVVVTICSSRMKYMTTPYECLLIQNNRLAKAPVSVFMA
jgi:hypothetical protein